jgi:hypothetical protein
MRARLFIVNITERPIVGGTLWDSILPPIPPHEQKPTTGLRTLYRNVSGTPIIASPLEAHRNRTIIYDTIGIDNVDGNPIFATLEVQYPDYTDVEDISEVSTTIQKQLA